MTRTHDQMVDAMLRDTAPESAAESVFHDSDETLRTRLSSLAIFLTDCANSAVTPATRKRAADAADLLHQVLERKFPATPQRRPVSATNPITATDAGMVHPHDDVVALEESR